MKQLKRKDLIEALNNMCENELNCAFFNGIDSSYTIKRMYRYIAYGLADLLYGANTAAARRFVKEIKAAQ